MIDAAYLECEMEGWVLVIEDLNGTHIFPCDPQLIEDALHPYRMHVLEGEAVRREREGAGGVSWEEFRRSQARMDPEWAEELAESVDLMRKQAKENSPVVLTNRDPGDEDDNAA